MEHIVQFAIDIDDDAIKKRVVEAAYNDICKELLTEAKKELRLDSRYYTKATWTEIVNEALHNYFDEHKDLIIELAATKLATSYRNSKAFKETMAQKMEEL